MNRNDIKFIITLLFIIACLFLFRSKKEATIANVYHDNDLILQIDLSLDQTYKVVGDNGDVIIEVLDHKIRVVEENSPYHVCSRQGYISTSGQSIVCLPNKIIITIENSEIDTQVK